jgi:hypothetical protein
MHLDQTPRIDIKPLVYLNVNVLLYKEASVLG